MSAILSQDKIDLICEAHRLIDMPYDIATHIARAQAQHLMTVLRADCPHGEKIKRECHICYRAIYDEVFKESGVTVMKRRDRNMTKLQETKAVKQALLKAGYTGVKVGHGTGTASWWLHLKANPLPGQTQQEKYRAVIMIAQQVTGRHGDYDGCINVGTAIDYN